MNTVPFAALARGPASRRRLAAAAGAVLIMLIGYLAIVTATSANAAVTLLSQGRPVTASSSENAGTVAANAVDGNLGTRWSSAFSNPQWIQIDLGSTAQISQVILRWEAAYATAFQIQTSADATNWASIYSTTSGTGGTQTLNVTGAGRYVRMYGTVRATGYGYSLWEFEVYGDSGSSGGCNTTTNAALNRPVAVSSTQSATFPGSAAVDGNAGTRWSSAASDPQWIQVDLGSTQSVCQVSLSWEAAYARSYQIQTSNDGSAWTTIYATTTSTGGNQTITVTGSGRYLRVYGTERATAYGYSLWELVIRTGQSTTPPTTPPTTAPPTTTPPTTSPPDPGGDVLLSYNKPGVASTSQNDGACSNCVPAKALDLNPATRWATAAWSDPGWIYVDLGAVATVHRVVLQWDPAFAVAYQIQVSNDATNWTSIYTTTTGHGFKETLTVNGTGRYVRMYGTARSNGYGYSLWEFQVYGTGGSPTTPPASPPDVTFPAGRLVFADEFNGAAGTKPDAKWQVETGPGVNNELQYYTNNLNASTDGAGNLVMEARREVTPGSACPGGPCQYTSSRLNTSTSFNFTYGHVEARIKVSGTNGLWPAFWLLGANFSSVNWPSCGEIDIMEHIGRVPNSRVFHPARPGILRWRRLRLAVHPGG